MKKITINPSLMLAMLLSIFSFTLSAQSKKGDCGKANITAVDIMQSDLKVEGGNIVFSGDAQFVITCSIDTKKKNSSPKQVEIQLIGKDIKGNKAEIKQEAKWNEKIGLYEANFSLKSKYDESFIASETNCMLTNQCDETTEFKESIKGDSDNPSYTVLLNHRSNPDEKKVGICCAMARIGNTDDGKFLKLDEYEIIQSIEHNSKAKNATYKVTIATNNLLKNENNFDMSALLIWGNLSMNSIVKVKDGKGKVHTINLIPVFDAERNQFIMNGDVTVENGIGMRLEECSLQFKNQCKKSYDIKSAYVSGYEQSKTDYFKWTETWKPNQKIESCETPNLNHLFMKVEEQSKTVELSLGFSKTKKDASTDLEKSLTENKFKATGKFTWQIAKDKFATSNVTPTESKEGKWIFNETVTIGDKSFTPILKSIEIILVNSCENSFSFSSDHKIEIKDANYDFKVIMTEEGPLNINKQFSGLTISGNSTITLTNNKLGFENPIFVGAAGSFTNVTAARLAGSNGPAQTVKDVFISIDVKDCKGKNTTFSSQAKYNEKTNEFEITAKFEELKNCGYTIEGVTFSVVNEKKDTIIFESNGKIATSLDGSAFVILMDKTEKIKYYDPCKTKFKLKTVAYEEATESGIYAVQFAFQFEDNKDAPDYVEMIVELNDCGTNTRYIRVQLSFDQSTGLYKGGVTLTQTNSCSWLFKYAEIAAYNTCKDKTVWSVEPVIEGNGSGTKNAASQTSGKPQLL